MLEAAILILFMKHGNGAGPTNVEFADMAACVLAKTAIEQKWRTDGWALDHVFAICVPKNSKKCTRDGDFWRCG